MPTTRPIEELLKNRKADFDEEQENRITHAPLGELMPIHLLEQTLIELEDMACEGEGAERMIRDMLLHANHLKKNKGWKEPSTDEKLKMISAIRKSASNLKELLDFELKNGRPLALHGHLARFINPDASGSADRYFDDPRFDPRAGSMAAGRLDKLSEDIHALAKACDSLHDFQDQTLREFNKAVPKGPYHDIALFLWDRCYSRQLKPMQPYSNKGPMARLFNILCRLADIPEIPKPVPYLRQQAKFEDLDQIVQDSGSGKPIS